MPKIIGDAMFFHKPKVLAAALLLGIVALNA
jgi:hypothetical protein